MRETDQQATMTPIAGREKPVLRVTTRRDVIARVRTAWRRQYYFDGKWLPTISGSPQDIYAALMRLDIATATRDQIDAIIGNDTWTENLCDGCGADVEALVKIGKDFGDDEAPGLCAACLGESLAALSGAPSHA